MPDEKVIDLDRLSRFHDNLKSNGLPLNNWQANKKYKVGYTVIQDGKFYRCKTEHTSTTTFDNTKFDLVGGSGSGIQNWTTNTSYSVGDLVIQDNNIYQCNTNHTSTTFTADASKWTLIGGQGASEELYLSNTWLDADTNLTLSSAVTPYDFIIIKVDYSLDGTNTEISKTVIATNDVNTNISLTLSRNSIQYCVVEGQLTSSTVFAVDALELTGFTKFRINKIIGVIGGGGSSGGDTPATSSQIQSLF